MDAAFILVAAGAGRRLGSPLPKAFVDLGGRPMLLHAFLALQSERRFVTAVIVVPDEYLAETELRVRALVRPHLRLVVTAGGGERQDSVRAGLCCVPPTCQVVLVHDAARPFVKTDLVSACLDAALRHGAATAATPVADTVKEVDARGAVRRTLERANLRQVQTPQAFRLELLRRAHEGAAGEVELATDDAALVERDGQVVWTVPGDPANIKITTAEDLAWARWQLSARPR